MTARSAAHQPSSSPSPSGPAAPSALAQHVIASDPHALDELSRSLRETVREAARQSATLRASVAQAARVAHEIKAGEQSQQENLALAAQAVTRIDERAREASELLEKVRSAAPAPQVLESLGTQIDALIEKRLGAFDSRVQSMLAAAESRWLALEQRAGSAMRALDDRANSAANAASQAAALAAVQSATRGVEQRLTPLVQRAESARERLDVILAGCELGTPAHFESTPAETRARTSDGTTHAPTGSASPVSDPHALLPVELRDGEAAAVQNPLPATGAGGSTGWAPSGAQVSDSSRARADHPFAASPLVTLLQRGEALRDEATFANRQLDAVRQQADLARKILGESLNDMCSMIDRLAERADDLRTQSDRAKTLAEELAADIAHKTEAARTETTEVLAEARSQAHAATEDLALAAAQARELIATTTLGNRVAEATISQLRTLVEQLEPWQGCVQNGAASDAQADADLSARLPVPVRSLIEQTREQMKRELSAVAQALHAAADRAAAIEPTSWSGVSIEPKREQPAEQEAGAPEEVTRRVPFEFGGPLPDGVVMGTPVRPVVFTGQSLIERLSGPEEKELGESPSRATSRSAASPLIPVTRVGVQTPVVLDR